MGSAATKQQMDPYVLAITIFAVACVAVAGTAVAIYLEVRFFRVLIKDENDLLMPFNCWVVGGLWIDVKVNGALLSALAELCWTGHLLGNPSCHHWDLCLQLPQRRRELRLGPA